MRRIILVLLLSAVALTAPLRLQASPAVDCEALASRFGAEAGLPDGLLASISRVEAGRAGPDKRVRGWPWTLNHRGKGYYFDTQAKALAFLRKVVDGGDRNVDTGCMQINVRWHAQEFSSLDQMLDPVSNVRYAARFLSALRAEHGSWDAAIKHYHSANPEFNVGYLSRVKRVWGAKTPDVAVTVANARLPNWAPLAQLDGSDLATALMGRMRGGDFDIITAPPPDIVARNALPGRLQAKWDQILTFRDDFSQQNPVR